MARIAVILSGCGVFDGSEIHEATATLLALDRSGADVTIAAPTGAQMHVVDHQAGEPAAGETRDIRIESARIARGPVADVADLSADDFDAVILPGGFGAAKNLCDFAVSGADCTVNPAIAAFVTDMHAKGKVVGAMCIAPALVAKVLGGQVKLTIGSDPDTAAALEAAGATHVDAGADEIVVDEENRVVSTPAYMLAGSISEVFDGIDKLVKKVIELC
ncbi:isoprenoid biosynthesis glyoxalase ElbB [bacterium]|nr:isoprenoid biosynthesis glyoxalase ElbB [bacterium]